MANVHLSAMEQGDSLVFLHKVQPGPASQSYGLQVARLAGLPQPVIDQARIRLQQLETASSEAASVEQAPGASQTRAAHKNSAPVAQQDLFAGESSALLSALDGVSPDNLTPREALAFLYQLKELSCQAQESGCVA